MATKPRPSVQVRLYMHEHDNETTIVNHDNAELHISTNGVLVIRRPNNGKSISAYSAGTWHSAEAGEA